MRQDKELKQTETKRDTMKIVKCYLYNLFRLCDGFFMLKEKNFYLQHQKECKIVEVQCLKTAQNVDRTLQLQGGDLAWFIT